jgi:hypothetical protein
LVRGQRLNDPVLKQLAKKHNKTEAQILLRWSLQMVCLNFVDMFLTILGILSATKVHDDF